MSVCQGFSTSSSITLDRAQHVTVTPDARFPAPSDDPPSGIPRIRMGQETPREPSEEDKSLNERPGSIGCSGSCDMGLWHWQLLPRGRGCGSSRSCQVKHFRLVKAHCQPVITSHRGQCMAR